MKVVLFYHSFVSCWNNGHAHFLRGIARALIRLGHDVHVFEPDDGWSRLNALKDGGAAIFAETAALVPGISLHTYRDDEIDLDHATDGAGLVIVQEWNTPALVSAVGRHRAAGARYTLLFHDSHHRSVTAPGDLDAFDLDGYDGVLAFGEVVREAYLRRGWARRAFTWHEAADTALFRPVPETEKESDLIWIGNWGDEERSRELHSFVVNPSIALGLRARIHGVRYPQEVRDSLAANGIDYAGWLPNHRAPQAYARAHATIHVPRRPYSEALPGIPTIRVFEALACGIPLICSPWRDEEGLFPQGAYLSVSDELQMRAALAAVLQDRAMRDALVDQGLRAVAARHTCAHRVGELLDIAAELADQPIGAAAPARNAALERLAS
jgi:spore maturation protein CgeB